MGNILTGAIQMQVSQKREIFLIFLLRFRNLREIWIFSKNKMTVIAHIFWKFRTPKYVAR